jgi:tRNA pseudouridine55 synthase
MKGFINLIKPAGMSSARAVTAVKKKFNCPCGHMGTLDPMASGVLPVGIGKASRLFQYMLDKDKIYIARFKFGLVTDTLDTTGETLSTTDYIPTEEEIKENLKYFIGEIDQVPPKYSAKCIDGKRGYQLARSGVEFTLSAKKVRVLDFKLISKISNEEYEFEIHCKGGTYIRSLARDLGEKCNSLAIMSALTRAKSGIFTLENGVSVEDLEKAENPIDLLIPADKAVDFPKLILSNENALKILNGVFENHGYKDGTYRVYNENEFWGVGTAKDGVLKINSYVR